MNCVEKMSFNCQLTDSGGARSAGALVCRCFGGWKGYFNMIATSERPRQASRISTMLSFPSTPCVWGPNRAHIASDRCDLWSHFLFVDTQVESELSSSCTWQAGENFSSDHVMWLPKGNSVFLGKNASSIRLEAVHWLWGCQL